MCGIAGIFDFVGKGRCGHDTLSRMAAAVTHRGPDDSGCFVDDDVALGFRRLSIVDLAGGQQPMWNEQRSVVSICNGEIFNHAELRARLEEQGHTFVSQCDVEVLPHLYEAHGLDLVDHLNGQFAFVLYDRPRRRLVAARDHFGVVPLFYTVADGLFLFGSEIKALLQHPAVCRRVDLTGLDQILCFPGLVSPTTMFEGISSLSSGHLLTVSEHGIETREYWDLNYPTENAISDGHDERYYVEGVEQHLRQSVRRRLMADVPLGVYLSGGLDSSIIAALACEETPEVSRHSFGISFNGDAMCERRYQQCMSAHLGTTHHDVPFGCHDVIEGLSAALYHAECPVKESYDTACFALSKTVKDTGVSVVLTGQGADELFGGYVGYKFDQYYSLNPTFRPVDADERRIRSQLWGDETFGYDRDYAALQRLRDRLYSAAVRRLLPKYDCLRSLPIRKDRVGGRHLFHKRSYLDVKLRLADHLLGDHGDRMAMANAVEIRHPFLDVELVKFVAEIPPNIQLKDLTEKYLLRQVAQSIVPAEILNREKFGWFAHGTPQLLRHNNDGVRELLSSDRIRKQGYFDPSMIDELKTRYGAEGFRLSQPFEADLLLFVLSFTALVDIFHLPHLN